MDVLKGNFKVKKEVKEHGPVADDRPRNLSEDLRSAALHTIGGSMVYMEREMLSWEQNDTP